MKRIWPLALLLFLLLGAPALAHVENEKTLYDDLEHTQALEDIVFVRALGLVSAEGGAKLFRPQAGLRKADLAYWAGVYHRYGGGGKSEEQVRDAALKNGLVDSLEGDAAYEDVSRAYFGGQAPVEKPGTKLTRAELAVYLRKHAQEPIGGQKLLDKLGITAGPSGVISKVTSSQAGEGSSAYPVYRVVIGGREYGVSPHPKALYGPADLKQWEGKTLAETWISGANGTAPELQVLKLEKGQFGSEAMEASAAAHAHHHDEPSVTSGGFPVLPLVAALLGAGIVFWLVRGKKFSK
ncbi:hypothetical protein PM3016_4459 [Paenibacillus mucilaginosus 3016]|uniref:SLH domain-containing protein n=2 Tax=Paenibacillus mucilaginosus TaxID=61624 RepID=H6NQ32_9BACL|nr:hypothetical protein [Paenibacillus mucilaginosus]AFC31223.1 hypothetical protein PM3016_4459 [Paenibacillus mucilaginosus 3016]AFH63542.1 hypothetical protein B2K_23070 [Paenibacillus mucilaginosus K02]WFA19789.1 hypothetical protein ERY13_22375 [Paenibacillus mucilaginosus]